MRILHIIPASNYGQDIPSLLGNTDFPTGFGYIASALDHAGHRVFGLNPNNIYPTRLKREYLDELITGSLNEFQPELICVGGLCTEYKFIKDTIDICRAHTDDTPIVCGGGIINNDHEYIFNSLKPDFCVRGDGEEVVVKLADALMAGRRKLESINNLCFWRNNVPVFTDVEYKYPDLDTRPFPLYEVFDYKKMLDNYSIFNRHLYRYPVSNPRPMTIVAARGCPFNCTFCVHERGPKYRTRSIDNILEELELMYEKFNFNILIVLDELFAANKSRLLEFCEAISARKNTIGWDFKWSFQTHASCNLNLDDLKMLKNAGCYFFSYGLESASPEVLSSMKKKTSPTQIMRAIEYADKAELGFGGNFIFGDPAENEKTIGETISFVRNHATACRIDMFGVQPYPGSSIFDYCLKNRLIRDRRHYYEFDVSNSVFNMTKIPDRLWYLWIFKLSQVNDEHPWAVKSEAKRTTKETDSMESTILKQYCKDIIAFNAECPYCHCQNIYREPIDDSKAVAPRAIEFLTNCFEVLRNDGWRILNYANKYVIPRVYELLITFGILCTPGIIELIKKKDQGRHGNATFYVMCKNCNKAYNCQVTT